MLTPTQRAILKVLSDGQLHRREELHACLVDELGPLSNVQPHISRLRKHLHGQVICCVLCGQTTYYALCKTP